MRKYIKAMIVIILISLPLLSCISRKNNIDTNVMSTIYSPYNFGIRNIVMTDSNSINKGTRQYKDLISNIAKKYELTIYPEPSEQTHYLIDIEIIESKYTKDIESYFSILTIMTIVDKNQNNHIKIISTEESKISINSYSHIHEIFSLLIRSLKNELKEEI